MKVANHFNFTASFSKPRKISCSPRFDKIRCELAIIESEMIGNSQHILSNLGEQLFLSLLNDAVKLE